MVNSSSPLVPILTVWTPQFFFFMLLLVGWVLAMISIKNKYQVWQKNFPVKCDIMPEAKSQLLSTVDSRYDEKLIHFVSPQPWNCL